MASANELVELSKHLKQERLFIQSERDQLQILNESVTQSSERLSHLAWVTRNQRTILEQLILGCQEVTPERCFQQNNALESVSFVDGYKHLSYHEAKVGEFLKFLRENPKVVALLLLEAEKLGTEHLQKFAQMIVSGIFGNGIMSEDETSLLEVLKHLIEIQVVANDNPRRLLRRGSCAFSIVFKLLNEGMFSAKLFLTAALHKPVMQLLMDVEWFYDIDPNRALTRFPHKEQLRRFGQAGSKEYVKKTKQYRDLMVNKLQTLAEQFLSSIRNNMYCFPQSLAWIVSNLYQTVTKAQKVDPGEVRAICADLVLTFFICPAICDPEPFGITSDAPISYIARHNLMQVAQILQVLAMDGNPEDADPKARDLYQRFERGCMSFLLDLLLESNAPTQPPQQVAPLPGCCRLTALLTCTQLTDLYNVVKTYLNQLEEGSAEYKHLDQVFQSMPPPSSFQQAQQSSRSNTPTGTPQATPPGTPSSIQKLKRLRDKKRLFLTPDAAQASEVTDEPDSSSQTSPLEEVMVVSLGVASECPGMLTEQKVLEQESKPRKFNSLIPGEDDPISESDIPLHEKRTRFSLSHDQDSIATSDNLEAISEAASSHSVGSDLDNENDNLSDMVSANVSGRGTPNISGRDTPQSLVESQAEAREERDAPNLPVTVQKNNREDVTERFGKFEIKQELERYEIKSTVSDTWSTDVLASDSEPPDGTQYERLSEVAEEMARHNLLGVVEVSEISETTSDAWSVDVLASDTSERQMDRLLELDQDDVCSISSRSQAQDSEIGDAIDPGEDTPQAMASGAEPQSPGFQDKGSDHRPGLPANLRIAAGGLPEYPSGSHRADRRKVPSDRYSDISSDRSRFPEFSGILKNGEDVRRKANSMFHPSSSFDNLDSGVDSARQDSRTDLDSYRSGDSGSRRNGRNLNKEWKENRSFQGGSLKDFGSENFQGSSGNSDSSGRSSSPFTGEPTAFGSPIKSSRGGSRSASCLDALSNDLSNSVKISEQQNVKIDASRLSAVLDIFDPLSNESNNNNPDLEKTLFHGSSQDSTLTKSQNELGARPKVPNSEFPSSMPRIAFIEASLDEGQDYPLSSNPNRPSSSSGIRPHGKNPFSSEPGIEPLPGTESFSLGSGTMSTSEKSSTFPTRNGNLRRDVPGGVTNDLVVLSSTSKTSQSDWALRSGEESRDAEDRKKEDAKKKPGLLHIFREKWHKGGKRKVKDKEETDGSPRSHGDGNHSHSDYSRHNADDPFSPPDTTDDILDKYRWQSNSPSSHHNEASTDPATLAASSNQNKEKGVSWDAEEEGSQGGDSTFVETKKAFADAKKKLRLVLSTADFQAISSLSATGVNTNPFRYHGNKKDNDLVALLRVQLAEAINLQDKDLVAQLHETIRCLTPFDNTEIKKLLKTMKEEYRSRSPYIAYLVKCRQGLLSTIAYLDRLLNRIQRNKAISNKYFISVLVRLFLEKKERECNKFVADFKNLTMSDEKSDLVEKFLETLNKQLEKDVMWKAANPTQMEEAQLCVEWNVMSSIYVDAMYPNADGDIYRDQILHDQIQKLAQVITPNHKELSIPRMYHYECPWPAAQSEIYMINAYKTPKDKVQCVCRCSTTIMNLLSMASDKSVPAADDFIPVLIFVLIKANPPSLLSTVQFVNSFYEKRMGGEAEYWWRQFCSAIEYIKMMIMRNTEGFGAASSSSSNV